MRTAWTGYDAAARGRAGERARGDDADDGSRGADESRDSEAVEYAGHILEHGFDSHGQECADVTGSKKVSKGQYRGIAEEILEGSVEGAKAYELERGRTVYYDPERRIIVIKNVQNKKNSTMFRQRSTDDAEIFIRRQNLIKEIPLWKKEKVRRRLINLRRMRKQSSFHV